MPATILSILHLFTLLILRPLSEVVAVIILILQISRHREVKQFTQSHTAEFSSTWHFEFLRKIRVQILPKFFDHGNIFFPLMEHFLGSMLSRKYLEKGYETK